MKRLTPSTPCRPSCSTSSAPRPSLSSLLALAIVSAAVLTAAPIATAQGNGRPFGGFNQVQGNNAVSGVTGILGWALDDSGIQSVDVVVDGRTVGRAIYGVDRPDVTPLFPGYPDTAHPGFSFQLDTTRFLNGLHTVSTLVTSKTGERQFLRPLVLQFTNTTHNLVPFGTIERPELNKELFGRCDTSDPQRRLAVVTGYALDVGVEKGDMGIGYVELMVDGALLKNSNLDCSYNPLDPITLGRTGCYGERRLDVENRYPLVKDAPHAGFRFILDVGDLLAFGFAEGHHVLTVRAGDISGQVADIDEIPVTFRCDDDLLNEPSYGAIDLPAAGLFFGGVVQITGYALDFEGVDRVETYVDGALRGNAVYGLPRPGIGANFPGYPNALTGGWSFALDTRALANSFHQVQVIAVDDAGASTLIGERTFLVYNAP